MTNNFEQNNKRIEWVDYMKVVGMFFIIYGHIFPRLYISQAISAFFVPVFFIISGFLCTKTYHFIDLLKRLKTTIILYLLLCSINYIIHYFIMDDRHNLFQFFKALLIGDVNIIGTMWFVYTLLLIRIIHNYILMIKYLPLITIIICLLVLYFASPGIRIPNGFLATVISLPFFELGYIIAHKYNDSVYRNILSIKKHGILYLIIAFTLYSGIWILGHINDYVTFYQVDYGNSILLFIIEAIAGIYATFIISILLQKITPNLKHFFRVMSFGNIFTLAFQMYFVVWAQTFIGHYLSGHFRYIIPSEVIAAILILLIFAPFNHLYYNIKSHQSSNNSKTLSN